MKKLAAYTFITLGILLGIFAALSAITSIPKFLSLNFSQPYSWGYIVGRVFTIILIFLIANASIKKGKKLKVAATSDV